jgi:hypothetical protein
MDLKLKNRKEFPKDPVSISGLRKPGAVMRPRLFELKYPNRREYAHAAEPSIKKPSPSFTKMTV